MATNFPQDFEFPSDFGARIPEQLAGRVKWIVLIVVVIVALVALSFLKGIYVDWLWFGELGFRGVFVKIIFTRVALFLAGGVTFGVLLGISLYLANRLSTGPEETPLPQSARDFLRALKRWGTVIAAIVLSVVFGTLLASQWEPFLKFWSGVPFNIDDPVFGNDISFYVFNVPVFRVLQTWLLGTAVVVLLASLGLYFINYSFRGVGFVITPGLKIHVSVIAALLMFTIAFGHWLDRWDLLLSDRGAVFGAAFTDLNARKPALLVLTIIAAASGVLILVNAYIKGIRLLVGGIVLWIVASVLLTIGWPNFMQQFQVNPNEFVKEQPYISRNIDFTRRGFGLEGVIEQPYDANPVLEAELVAANPQTIDNIRLWDNGPLAAVYRQIQLIRPYYDFKDADVDRYVVGGEYRQVMLAAREVAQEKLDPEAQTWVNTRLRYTHGFGLAMSPVTEFTPEGRPEFFAKDIPQDGIISVRSTSPDAEPDVLIENPRVYYGEKTTDYVIVNTNTEELDYQTEEGQIRSTTYSGSGGVPLSSVLQRIVFAWHFGDVNILISGEITGVSRIQFRREIQDRVSTVAPFLHLDQDPYLVATEGGLFWLQDAYTVTSRYPYSDPDEEGFNYIRNSVKVSIDAFDGSLVFYVADELDPLVKTYQDIFPKLFQPMDSMPQVLREHIRYPQDYFRFQAEKYLKYHMQVPVDFYNLEDLWSIPSEKFGQTGTLQTVEPYYVIMKIPGEDREEFVLLLPYTRNEPPIMAGWLAARNDGENYGKLVAFNFPKDRQVDGPEQIEAKIDNDPDISQWLTLRCQEGSTCIRGNLLVIPLALGDELSLLYAEPIYLQAEGVEFPELKQVILASQEKVVMRDSVPEALAALTGFTAPAPAPADGQATPAPAPDDQAAGTVQSQLDAITDALSGLRGSVSELEDALERLRDLTGGE